MLIGFLVPSEQLVVLLLQAGEPLVGSVALSNQAGPLFTEPFDLLAQRPPLLLELLQAGELLAGCVPLPNQAGPFLTELFDLLAKRPPLLFELVSSRRQLSLGSITLLANGRGLLLGLGDLGPHFLGHFLEAGRFCPGFLEQLLGSAALHVVLG